MASPFAPLSEELDALRVRLGGGRPGSPPIVETMERYFLAQPGQLLRPGLVLAAARVGPAGITDATRHMAELVELLHGASLLHDDVVDDAETRRQQTTVYRLYGDRESVLLGDLLLARAVGLLGKAGDPALVATVARITDDLARGQLLELEAQGRPNSVGAYLAVIERKTATFFGHSARLGGRTGGVDPASQDSLASYGTALGFAYQILDDLLDAAGREDQVGKTLGSDLANGRCTLPLLRLMEIEGPTGPTARALADPEGATHLAADPTGLATRIFSSGAYEAVVRDARSYCREAESALGRVRGPGSRRILEDLLTYLFERVEALSAAPDRHRSGTERPGPAPRRSAGR